MKIKISAKFLAVALVAIAALFGTVQPAQAQASGATSVSVTLQGVVILYYYSQIDVTVDSASLVGLLTGTAVTDVATASGAVTTTPALSTTLTGTLVPGPTTTLNGGLNLTSVPLVLNSAWAVRSLSGGGTVSTQVAITAGANNSLAAVAPAAGSIGIVSRNVRVAPGAFGATTSWVSLGLASVVTGDVQLGLNLSTATAAGQFTTAGTEFVLTATNI